MEYRRLGKAGIKLSALSLPDMLSRGSMEQMIAAYDAGVNFFDNAEAYAGGNAEIVMGNVIKEVGWKREDLVISTKIFWGGSGPNDTGLSHKHIIEGMGKALKRLQMDYVDLVFCHRPDPNTPIEETVRAMDIVIKQGKAFYWGTSEWNAAQIQEATRIAYEQHLTPPSMEQPQYNMFTRDALESDLLPVFKDLGYGTTIWSPLASGLLTGKYNEGVPQDSRAALEGYEWLQKDITDEKVAKVRALKPIADELDCSLAQLGLAWCLSNPNVSTVITGASRASQVTENMRALDVAAKLTPDVLGRIDAVLDNKPQ